MDDIGKALAAEFFGTFTLVFIGCSAVAVSQPQGGTLFGNAFAFGLALMISIYTWSFFSGGHFNPAVSLGVMTAGQMSPYRMGLYWIAQFLGGIVAASLIAFFFGISSGIGASIGSLTFTAPWKAVLVEAILTFFLVITVLMVSNNPKFAVVSGVAIGLVLAMDILAGGWLTGGSMNPSRSLGPAIFSNNMSTYWIYLVGPLLGAAVAAIVFRMFNFNAVPLEKQPECATIPNIDSSSCNSLTSLISSLTGNLACTYSEPLARVL